MLLAKVVIESPIDGLPGLGDKSKQLIFEAVCGFDDE